MRTQYDLKRFLGMLVLCSAFLLIILGFFVEKRVLEEVFKGLVNLILVSVIGSVISLMTFEYQRDKNNHDKKMEIDRLSKERLDGIAKSCLMGLNDCYNKIKRVRRVVRSKSMRLDDAFVSCDISAYEDCMDVLIDCQLELECVLRGLENERYILNVRDDCFSALKNMEQYLNIIITEFERNNASFSHGGVVDFEKVPLFYDFLKESIQGGGFVEKFVSFYKISVLSLRETRMALLELS